MCVCVCHVESNKPKLPVKWTPLQRHQHKRTLPTRKRYVQQSSGVLFRLHRIGPARSARVTFLGGATQHVSGTVYIHNTRITSKNKTHKHTQEQHVFGDGGVPHSKIELYYKYSIVMYSHANFFPLVLSSFEEDDEWHQKASALALWRHHSESEPSVPSGQVHVAQMTPCYDRSRCPCY